MCLASLYSMNNSAKAIYGAERMPGLYMQNKQMVEKRKEKKTAVSKYTSFLCGSKRLKRIFESLCPL